MFVRVISLGDPIHMHLVDARSFSRTYVRSCANDTTATKAGKVVRTGVITVAKDGKSRVVRLTGTDANGQQFTDVTYYDKQQ